MTPSFICFLGFSGVLRIKRKGIGDLPGKFVPRNSPGLTDPEEPDPFHLCINHLTLVPKMAN